MTMEHHHLGQLFIIINQILLANRKSVQGHAVVACIHTDRQLAHVQLYIYVPLTEICCLVTELCIYMP